jgi:tRNA(adenine34) deaminase
MRAEDERFMKIALAEAARAAEHGDVPIGAVVVHAGEVLAAAGNERELRKDPTAHAEVLVLREAAAKLGGWRVPGGSLYVTLEPCAMCAGAIVLARVPRVVYGTADPKSRPECSLTNPRRSCALSSPTAAKGVRPHLQLR